MATGVKHLANEPDGVFLCAFHEDIGVQLGDTYGEAATNLFHGLQDGGILYVCRHYEILQLLINEIDSDGVAIVFEGEQRIWEWDVIEFMADRLCMG